MNRRSRIEVDNAAVEWIRKSNPSGLADSTNLGAEEEPERNVLFARLKAVDAENTRWLKSIVEQHGWPAKSLVGADGAEAAWLLVQHADAEPH